MTFLQPAFLLVCLGALVPLAALRGATLLPAGLPGGWSRLVSADMQAIVSGHVIASRDVPGALLAAGLWLALGTGLAEPVLKDGDGEDSANIAGRVLVLDMSEPAYLDTLRSAASDVAGSLPAVPVALVAATGDAFDIVPFTTDLQHIERYLSVLDLEVMPVAGHEPQRAMAHAEAMMVRAGMITGQTILLTAATTAPDRQLARDRWLRAVMHIRPGSDVPPRIRSMAEKADARLVSGTDADRLDTEFETAIASLLEDSPEISGQTPLQHWLIGLACLLWLFQFRRPS